jgi:hypothetical protein
LVEQFPVATVSDIGTDHIPLIITHGVNAL